MCLYYDTPQRTAAVERAAAIPLVKSEVGCAISIRSRDCLILCSYSAFTSLEIQKRDE